MRRYPFFSQIEDSQTVLSLRTEASVPSGMRIIFPGEIELRRASDSTSSRSPSFWTTNLKYEFFHCAKESSVPFFSRENCELPELSSFGEIFHWSMSRRISGSALTVPFVSTSTKYSFDLTLASSAVKPDFSAEASARRRSRRGALNRTLESPPQHHRLKQISIPKTLCTV